MKLPCCQLYLGCVELLGDVEFSQRLKTIRLLASKFGNMAFGGSKAKHFGPGELCNALEHRWLVYFYLSVTRRCHVIANVTPERQLVANRIWIRTLVRRSIYATIAFATAIALACGYFRIYSIGDLTAYVGMNLECHPVWKDLAGHRIQLGHSLDDVISKTEPVTIDRHGRFVELGYQEGFSFTGIQVIAMDGKLVRACAGSCTWDYTFFDAMSETDWGDFASSRDHEQRTVEYMGEIVISPEMAITEEHDTIE